MQSTFTPSRSATVEPLLGVEAGVVQERRGAHQPGRDEHVAGRLRPAGGGGAPREVAVARAEPVLGLDALAGQVALAVADRLRLARGARGEGDQRRVVGREVGGGGRRRVVERLVGDRQQRAGRSRRRGRRRRRARRRPRRAARRGPSARAGPSAAAARCRAARRRRSGSRRPSPRPTRAGCRSPSSRRRRGRRPCAASVPARRAARSESSPKVISRREPSRRERHERRFRGWRGRHNFRCEVHAKAAKADEMLVTNLINMRKSRGTGWSAAEPLATVPARRGHARRVARGTQVVGANLLTEARKLFQREPVS